MGITAARLKDVDLIDGIISEPLGGAHRDYDQAAESIKNVIRQELAALAEMDTAELVLQRQARLRGIGFYQ